MNRLTRIGQNYVSAAGGNECNFKLNLVNGASKFRKDESPAEKNHESPYETIVPASNKQHYVAFV
jgi:hypothetical protein